MLIAQAVMKAARESATIGCPAIQTMIDTISQIESVSSDELCLVHRTGLERGETVSTGGTLFDTATSAGLISGALRIMRFSAGALVQQDVPASTLPTNCSVLGPNPPPLLRSLYISEPNPQI